MDAILERLRAATGDDPIEFIVRNALAMRGVDFVEEPHAPNGLDFYLPESGVSIECKQFHSPRISEQMSRVPNVIAIQGKDAALAFYAMLNGMALSEMKGATALAAKERQP